MLDRKKALIFFFIFDILAIFVIYQATQDYIYFHNQVRNGSKIIEFNTGNGYGYLGFLVLYAHFLGIISKTNWYRKNEKAFGVSLAVVFLLLLLVVPRVYDYKIETLFHNSGYQLCGIDKEPKPRLVFTLWYKGTECPSVSEMENIDN